MTTPPLVVVTGAAGVVGRLTGTALDGVARLRLLDRSWPQDLGDDPSPGERVTVDLRDLDATVAALEGADAVVHLAGNPQAEQSGGGALSGVAELAVNVAEAAVRTGVRRIVHASSVHAAGLYLHTQDRPISARLPARPCCEYGAAKVFAENTFALVHERTGAQVVALRLGLIGWPAPDLDSAQRWLGAQDYGRLLRAALTTPVGHEVLFAVSATGRHVWDLAPMGEVFGAEPREQAQPETQQPGRYRRPGERCLMHPPAPGAEPPSGTPDTHYRESAPGPRPESAAEEGAA